MSPSSCEPTARDVRLVGIEMRQRPLAIELRPARLEGLRARLSGSGLPERVWGRGLRRSRRPRQRRAR